MDYFTRAYLECALWASTDDDCSPLDNNYDIEDFAPCALELAIKDCAAFQESSATDLLSLDDSQCGHDFWLTRNRHGAGFWDRGLGEVGERLTESVHAYGSCDVYIGVDGKLYLS